MCTIIKWAQTEYNSRVCTGREIETDRQTHRHRHTHTRHSIITTWLTIFRSPRNRYVVEWWCMFFDIQFTTWMRHSLSLCIAFGCSFGLMSLHDSSIHFYFTRFFARCLLCLFLPCSCLLFLLLLSFINFFSLASHVCSDHPETEGERVQLLYCHFRSSRVDDFVFPIVSLTLANIKSSCAQLDAKW